ncbi:MAG TPA: hypothetical protein VFP35_00565 [Candidatus Saccharimonadales bacterium]|nr:hypothetical protein [Candidatus Saccharimonadales bacterium]
MGEIFHEQRERHDYLDEPEISEVALRSTVIQILDSGRSPEDQSALIDEAKAESIRFGLDSFRADRIHQDALTTKAMQNLNSDLMARIREIKEDQGEA